MTTQLFGAETLPRYLQHVGRIHAMVSFVRADMGIGLVPETAANLRFNGVVMRQLSLVPKMCTEADG